MKLASVALGILFLLAAPAYAQDPAADQKPNDAKPKPAGTSVPGLAGDGNEDAVPTPPPGPPDKYSGAITQVGTGLPLWGTTSTPLRWGDFSISSFEYIGIRDRFTPIGVTTLDTNLTVFRTGLMFD